MSTSLSELHDSLVYAGRLLELTTKLRFMAFKSYLPGEPVCGTNGGPYVEVK